MKKKLFALAAVLSAAVVPATLAGCAEETGDGGLSADEAAQIIAGFTSSPSTVNATFRQTYVLEVDSDNESMLSFEQDIDDTVTVQADFTAGNLYYYGKKTDKAGEVTEQLLYKEGETYYYMTTSSVKTALENETAAAEMIDTLMNSLTRETSGYIDSDAFVYSSSWIHSYILLGSGTLTGNESSFEYSYEKTESNGLQITLNTDYIGYYGDAGTFEFGTDETHTGSSITVETDENGFITSFSQSLNNHLEMAIVNPPVPLDLTGSRSLTAEYGGTIEKKTSVEQELAPATVTFESTVANGTVAVDDIVLGENYNPESITPIESGDTVEAGHYIGIKVTPADGYEVNSVTINGTEVTFQMAGYYCYQVTEADYNTTLAISVTTKEEGAATVTYGTIALGEVSGCTVTTYDFDYSAFTFTPGNTVQAGHFVAFQVEAPSGVDLENYLIAVNGTEATFINGYYVLMTSAVAGETYTITITGAGTIELAPVENCTVKTYDFDYNNMKFVEGTTVQEKHFVAVSVTPDTGYTVQSVTINGETAMNISGYYVVVSQPVVAGTTYTVVVTLAASN